jgi:hypothetical protein
MKLCEPRVRPEPGRASGLGFLGASKRQDCFMTDKAASQHSRASHSDARDLLLRLYREIGISAVAAALAVTSGMQHGRTEPSVSTSKVPPDEKELAA